MLTKGSIHKNVAIKVISESVVTVGSEVFWAVCNGV